MFLDTFIYSAEFFVENIDNITQQSATDELIYAIFGFALNLNT